MVLHIRQRKQEPRGQHEDRQQNLENSPFGVSRLVSLLFGVVTVWCQSFGVGTVWCQSFGVGTVVVGVSRLVAVLFGFSRLVSVLFGVSQCSRLNAATHDSYGQIPMDYAYPFT